MKEHGNELASHPPFPLANKTLIYSPTAIKRPVSTPYNAITIKTQFSFSLLFRFQYNMATISLRHNQQVNNNNNHHQKGLMSEEIEGLIRVHKDGRVERPTIVPNVSCTIAPQHGVTSKDVVINKETNLWARVYVPLSCSHGNKLPLLVYFHGGGFCVGSAAWSCYHDFLTNLVSKAKCVVVSVDYRLAPENRLPVAYDDGFNALMWLKRESLNGSSSLQNWWLTHCNMSCFFLAGDSAG